MPQYEYVCSDEKCGTVTEKLRKVSERDDLTLCDKCGKESSRKVSVSSFQLKGGGWYRDGYAG